MRWDSIAATVTGRLSWLLGLGIVLLGICFMVLIGGNPAAGTAPQPVPADSDSAKVDALGRHFADPFSGGDHVPLIVVVSRADGAILDAEDVNAANAASGRMRALTKPAQPDAVAAPVTVSADGKAAIGVVPISADLSGLRLNDTVGALRTAADKGLPADLAAHVTGGPAFGADIANAFTDANVTLLAVTASVVAVLLIATYRSPVLWLAPLLVIAFADRVSASVGTAVASLTGLSFDGSTSGITSVLVFGAGTNYALLLISRYRQELRSHPQHRDALRRAVCMAGPAILASNATVVLALLTLVFASTPSTRSLGALAACGLVVASASVLLVLPPLLALCGRRLFWPFIPHPDDGATLDSGAWHRVAERVARRPALVSAGRDSCPGGPRYRADRNPDRADADRAVPRPGRVGVRLPDRGRAFSRRPDRSDAGCRPHRTGGTGGADHRRDPGCGLGDRIRPRGHWVDELVEVVCGDRRAAIVGTGIQNNFGTEAFDDKRLF